MELNHGLFACIFGIFAMLLRGCSAEIPLRYYSDLGTEGKVQLLWGFDNETILFNVSAETNGWIGIGFSKTGSMKQSDIIVMWMREEKAYILDMHAHMNGVPNVDDSQDYLLEAAHEMGEISSFAFSKKIENCDEFDSDMKEHTYRVIWALGDHDPEFGMTVDEYHGGTNRGVQSLKLMNPSPDPVKQDVTDDDSVLTYDIRPINLTLPARTTYYHCKMFRIPDVGQKHHIVEYEPIITAVNQKKVHHMTVHSCRLPGEPRFSEEGAECYKVVNPFSLGCAGIPMSYAIGSTNIVYPPNVGYPIGEKDQPQYLLLETHYNNPDAKVFTDSSGIRMYYTPKLRPIDAGVLMLGYTTSFTMAIPPGSKDFASQGHCLEDCVTQAFHATDVESITIIGGGLHAHETGRRLSLRHFRKGVELQPILKDDYYDVEYQAGQYLARPVTAQRGDSFLVQCNYDTTGRENITFGGLSIKDEMCTAYVTYYPRIDLSLCMSSISGRALLESFNATNYTEFLKNSQEMVWNDQSRQQFNDKALASGINPMCQGTQRFYKNYTMEVPVPTIVREYEETPPKCGSLRPRSLALSLWTSAILYHLLSAI